MNRPFLAALAGCALALAAWLVGCWDRHGVNLKVTAISGPASATPGEAITVTSTVENPGKEDASSFGVSFFLSSDREITVADVFIGSRLVDSLRSGLSDTAQTLLTVPELFPDFCGHYYLGAIADPTNIVAEADETDNVAASISTMAVGSPPAPDAYEDDDTPAQALGIVVDGSPQARTISTAGDDDWVVFTVSEPGGVVASIDSYFVLEFYDPDGVSLLARGQAPQSSIGCFFTEPGTYHLRVWHSFSVGGYTLSLCSYVPGPAADLAVRSGVDVNRAVALAGDEVRVNASVENLGTDGCTPSAVDFYLSGDATITVEDALLGRKTVPGLAAGGGITVYLESDVPAATPSGAYYVGLIVDPEGAVEEADEANNTVVGDRLFVNADVWAKSVSGPASANAGDTITLSWEIGVTPTGCEMYAASAYISDDAVLDEADWSFAWIYPATTGGQDVSLPTGLASGTYYFILSVDESGSPPETDYGNNVVVSSPVTVTGFPAPDLVVTDLSGTPVSLAPGETITVTDTVANTGDGDAGPFSVQYRLHTGYGWAMPFCILGERQVASLGAGESSTAITEFTLLGPPLLPGGCYFLEVRADIWADVDEKLERNNIGTTSHLVEVWGPDVGEPYSDWYYPYAGAWLDAETWPDDTYPVMTVHRPGDVDWITVRICTDGITLRIETYELRGGMDTIMELWTSAAWTYAPQALLATDDDSGTEPGASAITHTFSEDGLYLLRIYHKQPDGLGFYKVKSTLVE